MIPYHSSFHTDIKKSVLETFLPSFLIPYVHLARWDRPVGVGLLLVPCLWGLFLASASFPSPFLLMVYTVGALALRGAGCTYNDLVDCEGDKQVKRTSVRPLPSGRVTKKQALLFLGIQLMVGLGVLLCLPPLTFALGVGSLLLVGLYPWMKRWTYWPQAFLGLTFNYGVLMAWSTVKGSLSFSSLILYGVGILWTLIYDTIYAHQDREEDALAGIKSTALKFGGHTKIYLAGFTLGCLGLLIFLGFWEDMKKAYYIGLLWSAGLFFHTLYVLDTDDPENCLRQFKTHFWIGVSILLALWGGKC